MKQLKNARLQCWNCGQSLADIPQPISRHEHCPKCFEAVHCCRLCRHYRANETISCREDRADPPTIKENANFCDWFRPLAGAYSASNSSRSSVARSELDALFSNQADADNIATESESERQDRIEADKAELAKRKLDSLFSSDS